MPCSDRRPSLQSDILLVTGALLDAQHSPYSSVPSHPFGEILPSRHHRGHSPQSWLICALLATRRISGSSRRPPHHLVISVRSSPSPLGALSGHLFVLLATRWPLLAVAGIYYAYPSTFGIHLSDRSSSNRWLPPWLLSTLMAARCRTGHSMYGAPQLKW